MATIFFRKKREGANSIEMVFSSIDDKLLPHTNYYCPCEGASPINIIKNIIYAYKHRSAINHITGDIHYIAIGLGKNTILTIHDVQSGIGGNNPFKKLYVKLLWFYIPALIVKRITVISEFTKKELEALIPYAKHKISVIYNPFNTQIKFSPKYSINTQPIILHLGTKSNKNLERVIESLNGLDYKLIVLGKINTEQYELLNKYNISYENYYDIPYKDVISLYDKCDIVSFPSIYEGFGLPILEANAIGRPILAGDIEVLHEVANDAAYFVDPTNINEIRNGFIKLILDYNLRKNLIDKGLQNIKRFSSKSIAEQYNQLYYSIISRKTKK